MIPETAAFRERAVAAFPRDAARIDAAIALAERLHAGKERASGESAMTHLVAVAGILLDMGLDADSAVSGLLHDAIEDGDTPKARIEADFGPAVAEIVEGVTRISILKAKNKTIQQAETIRKMLFAMTRDLRVIFVKLADKLHNMRTLRWLPEDEQKRIATECVEIFAPLAERLGMSWLKDELEDLSLKALNRDAFDQIKGIVAAKKGEREAFLARVESAIRAETAKMGFDIVVESRAKHFYSIYQKMKRRNKGADELFDLLGIRVFCATREECYSMLGIVHSLWKPIDGRFKDYIAFPKANGYMSLHTTIMCFDGRLLEVQIRTHDMHRVAEYGIASHWLYKKGTTAEVVTPDSLSIVNRLKSWQEEAASSSDFLEEIKRELLKDSIFVFTPRGDAIELPAGSTPLDFAYHVHSAVGNACVGAKADGVIVPLSAELRNTQVIEILTSPQGHPHINWLRTVKTSKARAKIRQWLVTNDQALAIDKNIVARRRAEETRPEEQRRHPEPKPAGPVVKEVHGGSFGRTTSGNKLGLTVNGERNLMIRIAQCCRPIQGDRIIGYVSRGRGIIVHKAECGNLRAIPDFAERMIEAQWETVSPFNVRRYRVVAKRSQDVFSEIEGAIRKFKGHLIEGRLEDGEGNRLVGAFTMEFESAQDIPRAVKQIKNIPNIVSIQSLDGGNA